jgi:hypothetical protein
MNPLIKEWFRKVDIFADIVNQSGLDFEGKPWAKRFWKVAYRDARLRARIFNHSLDELIQFRNLGILKQIWADSGNVIGRIRTNNLSEFDNNTIAANFNYKDFAPNRILVT